MTLKRAFVPGVMLGLLIAAGPAWAGANEPKSTVTASSATDSSATVVNTPPELTEGGLVVRKSLPKLALHKPAGQSRLFVKFRDDFKARVTADKSVRTAVNVNDVTADQALELTNGLTSLDAIRTNFALQFVPAINSSEGALSTLQDRAASYSGKAQPDLAGMMYVDGPDNVLQNAAQQLQALGIVEYAYFQLPYKIGGPGGACCVPANGAVGCGGPISPELCETLGGVYQGDGSDCGAILCPQDLGACCIGTTDCVPLNQINCEGLNGTFRGIGTNCTSDGICDDPECGSDAAGDCFTPHPEPFCNDEDCCNLVCDFAPYCCDDDPGIPPMWDEVCVALANLRCEGGNRCATPFAGPCYNVHSGGGCNNSSCCDLVCAANPFCCEVTWNQDCVTLAQQLCQLPPDTGPTPNFAAFQGYLRAPTYDEQAGGVPFGLCSAAPGFTGFDGAGWTLFDPSLLEDNPSAPSPGRYQGLYGLGRNLNDPPQNGGYGVGPYNGARGRGVRVAVIEWAYYQGHEDLNVISEPGQTLIMIPSVTHPDHATACLGIINAQVNNKGMVGIAPDAQAYFFPLTSIEEGPRELTAFARALQTLGAGDVISCSFGPGPVTANLNNDAALWPILRLAADLGITTCIAAGNDCFNVDDSPNLGDSGAIVVGASYPGFRHCRLSFSNFDQGTANTGSNTVHVNAWGECVASTGGSANLFFPSQNWNRSYCTDFNGTSAATPQIAGLAACLQGLCKQFFGIPLLPEQIRAAIRTGFPQCGVPNPADLPGFPPDLGCAPDTNPDEEPNLIGPYPNPYACGGTILSQSFTGFDQSPLVDDVVILRGALKFGNKFSVKANEQNYLVVTTQYTTRKNRPNVAGPASSASYLGNGQVFDVMIKAHSNIVGANTIAIDTNVQYPGQTTIWMIELYDWNARRWTFADIRTLDGVTGVGPDGDHGTTSVVTNAARFINTSNKQILVRVYATILGFQMTRSSAASSLYDGRLDWVNVRVSNGFGVIPGVDGSDPSPPTD